MRRFFNTIRSRIYLIVFITLIPLIVFGVYSAQEEIESKSAETNFKTIEFAQRMVAEQGAWVGRAHSLLDQFAQSGGVRDDRSACSGVAQSMIANNPSYTIIGIADSKGDIVCSWPTSDTVVNIADRKYFKDATATGQFSSGEYVIGRITGKASLHFAVPIFSRDGTTKEVLFVGINLSWLNEKLATSYLPPNAIVEVIAQDGTILAHYPDKPDYVGQKHPEDPAVQASFLIDHGEVYEGIDHDGVLRIYATRDFFTTNEGQHAHIAIGVPKSFIYQDIYDHVADEIILIVSMILVVLFMTHMLVRKLIVGNARQIALAAQTINRGKYGSILDVSMILEELRPAAEAFNDMSKGLQQRSRELTETKKEFGNLIKGSVEVFFSLSPDGTVTSLNDAFITLTGWKPSDWVGKPFIGLVHPDDRAFAIETFKKQITHQITPIYRLRVLTNRGTDTYVTGEFNAGASVKNGKVVGVVGIARDITSQLDAEKKIAALNDLRNTFIQIVSHQLRTPLNAIRWNLETLLAEELGKLRQSQKDFIRVTLGADVEVIDRIHEFLTALDIEEGRANFNPEDVALQSLIKDVMPTYEQKAKLKSVKLTYVPSRKAVPKLKIDQAKMRTVLELLIDNAITYTPQGGNVTITLSANGRIRLEVADTGVGIPATDQEKIFEKFFRSSNAILVKPDSSGLGLYIAHYYVTKQGGTIGFTSSAEKGSVFWIEFPL